MTKKCKIRYGIPAAVCIIAIIGSFYAFFLSPLSAHEATQYVYIDEDDDIDSVAAKLSPIAKRHSLEGFTTMARHSHYPEYIRTGRYAIEPGERVMTVFRHLRNGIQTPMRLTVPSVRTVSRMAKELGNKLMADSASFEKALTDATVCQELGFDTATVMAMFIPNSYDIYWNISTDNLLKRLKKEYDNFWDSTRKAKANALSLSPIEVSILASIVDEETANDGEKPTIAGLYYNRLQQGMLLQADPTVKYALQQFSLKRIYNSMLNTDNPYNTYRYKGLPPGPIRNPSVAGIDAVLNMQRHNYLYMCAKEDFSGTHNFAATLAEHQQNARRYVQALNERNIK
ncbi:MAG: endolytic transglycosylase MltG [Prevotella sp.]|nr:endolytic transglycosylase MltG [Prevotella sp.]